MKIEIDPTTEQPATLRALAAMLVTLAGGEVARPAAFDFTIDEAEMAHQFAAETRDQVDAVKHAAEVFAATEATTTPLTAAEYFHPSELAEPVRVAPLPPPAPPIAAAALFSTAPVVPTAGAPTPVPPPPVPSVPVPPALLAPAPVTDPALDVNGVAWDAALHASTKAKNVDGTWRARRNLSDKAVTPPAAPVPPPPPAINSVATPPAPTLVPLPPAAPVPPPPVPGLSPFPRMMRTITDNLTAGRITKPQVNEVLAAHGVMDPGQIAVLATLPDTAAKVTAALVTLGAQNV